MTTLERLQLARESILKAQAEIWNAYRLLTPVSEVHIASLEAVANKLGAVEGKYQKIQTHYEEELPLLAPAGFNPESN